MIPSPEAPQMHRAVRKAIETDALQGTQAALSAAGPRLERREDQLDRDPALLEQPRPGPAPQQQPPKGGNR